MTHPGGRPEAGEGGEERPWWEADDAQSQGGGPGDAAIGAEEDVKTSEGVAWWEGGAGDEGGPGAEESLELEVSLDLDFALDDTPAGDAAPSSEGALSLEGEGELTFADGALEALELELAAFDEGAFALDDGAPFAPPVLTSEGEGAPQQAPSAEEPWSLASDLLQDPDPEPVPEPALALGEGPRRAEPEALALQMPPLPAADPLAALALALDEGHGLSRSEEASERPAPSASDRTAEAPVLSPEAAAFSLAEEAPAAAPAAASLNLTRALNQAAQRSTLGGAPIPFDIEELGARFRTAALSPDRPKNRSVDDLLLQIVADLRGIPITLDHPAPQPAARPAAKRGSRPRRPQGGPGAVALNRPRPKARPPLLWGGVGAALLLAVLAVPFPVALDGGEAPSVVSFLEAPRATVGRWRDQLIGSPTPLSEEGARRSPRGVAVLSSGDPSTPGPLARAQTRRPRGAEAGGSVLLPERSTTPLPVDPHGPVARLEHVMEDAAHAQRNYDYREAVELYEQALSAIGPAIPWEMRVAVWRGAREAFLLRAEVILKDEYLVKEDCEAASRYLIRAKDLGVESERLDQYLSSAQRCFQHRNGSY